MITLLCTCWIFTNMLVNVSSLLAVWPLLSNRQLQAANFFLSSPFTVNIWWGIFASNNGERTGRLHGKHLLSVLKYENKKNDQSQLETWLTDDFLEYERHNSLFISLKWEKDGFSIILSTSKVLLKNVLSSVKQYIPAVWQQVLF